MFGKAKKRAAIFTACENELITIRHNSFSIKCAANPEGSYPTFALRIIEKNPAFVAAGLGCSTCVEHKMVEPSVETKPVAETPISSIRLPLGVRTIN